MATIETSSKLEEELKVKDDVNGIASEAAAGTALADGSDQDDEQDDATGASGANPDVKKKKKKKNKKKSKRR